MTGKACFVLKERDEYIPLLAAAHEMMRYAAKMCDDAREIEKSNDTVVRTPHKSNQKLLLKRALFEKEH